MKKVFLSLAIIAALTVVSCKQADAAATDTTAVDSTAAAATETIDSTASAATETVDSTAAAATDKVDAATKKMEDAKAIEAAPVKK